MKKFNLILISVLLVLSMLFAGCAKDDAPGDETSELATDETSAEVTTAEETTTAVHYDPVYVSGRYMPEDTYTKLKTIFEEKEASFAKFTTATAPYAIRDIYTVSNCKLKSITVPVVSTGAADANGDLKLTVYVVNNYATSALGSSENKSYELKVNAASAGLEANADSVYKFVKIDLTSLDIELGAMETLAFFGPDDTIVPAMLYADSSNTNAALTLLKDEFCQTVGSFKRVTKGDAAISDDTIFFDFEWEKCYESQEAYDKYVADETAYQSMLAELKGKYEGKKISILSDSISTFGGISNNPSYNVNIANNAIYYPNNDPNVSDSKYTYWGRLINDLGMELCVSNAWSGSMAYGRDKYSYKDNMLRRATQLHNTSTGEEPDIIIVYLGTNDLNKANPESNLAAQISGVTDTNSIVASWFEGVKSTAKRAGYDIDGDLTQVQPVTTGTTFKAWDEAYALGIKAIQNRYENAEIFCMTTVACNDAQINPGGTARYNSCIKAIAEYMGVNVINQQNDDIYNFDTCHAYAGNEKGGDANNLHPTIYGHALMERRIVREIFAAVNE